MDIFDFNPLYLADGYKLGHVHMLSKNTTRLYGTKTPRKIKYMPEGIEKIVAIGSQLTWLWLHNQFQKHFFTKPWGELAEFVRDMESYLGLPYDGEHFKKLYDLGYLPIRVKALEEGTETPPNVPHETYVNTVDGFAWLTLYLETIVSAISWKMNTSATLALQYRRNAKEWVLKTDPDQAYLIPFMCHDFSARGLSPWDMITSGIGHASCFRGSDSLVVIPASRKFYGETEVPINSVNATEHSVTCTKIFYYQKELLDGNLDEEINWYYSFDLPADGDINNPDYLAIAECLTLRDWLTDFPTGILSYVCDTFNTWKSATHIVPRLKKEIMERDGKLVLRPDSGYPPDIICGDTSTLSKIGLSRKEWLNLPQTKGVIELLWGIFGGTTSTKGYKVLDPHIGCIYGDAINLDKQVEIYDRLAKKGFAATNIILGVGSFTYQYNSRDSQGWAVKGAWFEIGNPKMDGVSRTGYDIYKDPATDNGTKKSLKGLIRVNEDFSVDQECTWEQESGGLLQTIYEDGKFYNQTTLTEIRERINQLV